MKGESEHLPGMTDCLPADLIAKTPAATCCNKLPFSTTAVRLARLAGKTLALLLLPCLTAPVFAQLNYTNNNGTITITKYTGPNESTAVVIPDTIDGLPVTRIGESAFHSMYLITNVTIPDGVTVIERDAFNGCTSLANVTIPAGVTTIGNVAFGHCRLPDLPALNVLTNIGSWAFYGCWPLTNVMISASVKTIGSGAFLGCRGTKAFAVDPLNPSFSSEDGVLFNKDQTTLLQYPGGKSGSYGLPNTVTNLGVNALGFCEGLTAITVDESNSHFCSIDGVLFNKSGTVLIRYPGGRKGVYAVPNGVKGIGDRAFSGSLWLTEISLPNSVTNIADAAFDTCGRLGNTIIPASVTSIGNWAFANCPHLQVAFFLGDAPTLGQYAFDYYMTVYYLPGTWGWQSKYGSCLALLWNPRVQTSSTNFGVQHRLFGFTITGTTNLVVRVQACTNLLRPAWKS